MHARGPARPGRPRSRRAPAPEPRPVAELREHVGRRLELDGPARAVLRTLRRERLGRAIVGDGRGHDHDVRLAGRVRAPRARAPRRSASRRARRRAAPATARFAPSSVTCAPRRRASAASATPMRPDERLPTKRTASIGSRVPPAEIRTRLPASGPVPASSSSAARTMSSGSDIRPTPSSPSAVSPSSGPIEHDAA